MRYTKDDLTIEVAEHGAELVSLQRVGEASGNICGAAMPLFGTAIRPYCSRWWGSRSTMNCISEGGAVL